MTAILDGRWRVGVSHIFLKVDQPKIISVQISDERISMHFFLSLKICIIGINRLKEKHRKIQGYNYTHGHIATV